MSTNQLPTTQQLKKPSSKGINPILVIVIVILVLLFIGGGISYYVYHRFKQTVQKITEKNTNNTPTSSEEGKLPATDVAGADLTNIPRYPDSIRSYYHQSQDINYTEIHYKAKATSEEILNFYKNQMPSLGWTLNESSEKNLSYSKNMDQITISVGDPVNSVTEYQLDYFASPTD